MAKIDAFFKLMNEQGASDLHLVSGSQPILRIRGDMERVKYKQFENDELKAMLYEIAPEEKVKTFEETGDVDFGYEIPGLARYRANFFQQKYGVGAVFREIPSEVLTAEQLGLPPVITKLALLPKGLVLVTGPTGSGKSTTLAAIVDYANKNRKDHIITVEDPIEFVHKSQGCIVNHREVGSHTKSFSAALRGALREDPDIILVGEMRDLETIALAIEAAATGHLVFGTLHTTSAAKTVDRVIEVFPANQQDQIRSTLADGIKAVIAQTLFKRIDKKPSTIQTGKKYGMQSLDDAIMQYLQKGQIDPDEAYNKCIDKSKFLPFLKKSPGDFTDV
ncbi:MAG: pilus retraction ATPase PilT [bacterium]|nr:MAG: pilus retraction ATPase PilT [bacterium]